MAEGLPAKLHARLARARREGRVPSMVGAVLVDGEVAWSGGVGRVDGRDGVVPTIDTQYRIGSITKSLTAAMVFQLRDEGCLGFDDALADHLDVGPVVADLRIVELLGHASGLRAETSPPWWERSPGRSWEEVLADVSSEVDARPAPRGVLHYSNVGYAILGRVVEELDGRPWLDALAARLLEPAGMTRTSRWAGADAAAPLAVHPDHDALLVEPVHDYRAMAPAGQLWSTVADLARWARAVSGRSPDVLSPAVAAEMGRARLVATLDPPVAFGLGLQVVHHHGLDLVGHGGSVPGFVATLFIQPDDGVGVVAVANSTAGFDSHLVADLVDLVGSSSTPNVDVGEPDPAGRELSGTWYWGPRPVTVAIDSSGTPVVDMGIGWRACRLELVDTDRWIAQGGYFDGEQLRVARREDGSIAHLELASFVLGRSPYEPADWVPSEVDMGGEDRT